MFAFAAHGCARYEVVPDHLTPECRRRPPDPVPSGPPPTVDTTGDATGRRELRGEVREQYGGRALAGAVVVLKRDSALVAVTDSAGGFQFPPVPAGRYELTARRIGYLQVRDSLSLPLAPTAVLRLVLAVPTVTLDGRCSGYVSVRVRKPWWKLW